MDLLEELFVPQENAFSTGQKVDYYEEQKDRRATFVFLFLATKQLI